MIPSPNSRSSYAVRALLAAGVLYYVLDLSRGSRGPIDYVVIVAVVSAIVWNLVQLARRLHADGGSAAAWWVLRTAGFWIIGGMNTVWIRPEDAGTWKFYAGMAVLGIALLDSIFLVRREHRIVARGGGIDPQAGPAR